MARITVEDCLKKIDSRFELVLLASRRVKQLVKEGAAPLVPLDGDKMTVVALREVADGLVDRSLFEDREEIFSLTGKSSDLEEIPAEIIDETQTTDDPAIVDAGEIDSDVDSDVDA